MVNQHLLHACLGIASLAAVEPASAITTQWNSTATGSYTDASKWSAGVPTSADTAVFNRNLNIEYGVTFPGRPIASPLVREAKQLKVGTNAVSFSDSVNLNQLPASFKIDAANTLLYAALIIGETAGQVATLNTALADFSTSGATIGLAPGSTGTLNVSGGTFNVTAFDELNPEFIVGFGGNGTLNISNGADVIGEYLNGDIRVGMNAVGTVSVTGTGSLLAAGELWIGGGGSGTVGVSSGGAVIFRNLLVDNATSSATVTGSGSSLSGDRLEVDRGMLTIQSGGHATSTTGYITGTDATHGSVDVGGVGSSWTVSQLLVVGYGGKGTLDIHDGGQVSALDHVHIGNLLVSPIRPGTGIVSVDGANSNFSANTLQVGSLGTGTLSLTNGGTVTVTNSLIVGPMGTVKGNGTVVGDVANQGVTAPGTSPGVLHVNGDYSQSDPGNLVIELGGTTVGVTHDQLSVSGALTAGGMLTVTAVDLGSGLYSPQPGDVFDILNFGSLSGTFSSVVLPSLSGNLVWNTSQLYGDGTIRVVTLGVPGDYNDNGTVDAADYILWRKGGPLANEVDLPGTVNAADYTAWRARFGNSGSGSGAYTSTIAAVPEPTTLVLLILARPAHACGHIVSYIMGRNSVGGNTAQQPAIF